MIVVLLNFFSNLERIFSIIVAGGRPSVMNVVEVLTGDHKTKQLPTLPEDNYFSTLVLHNGTILLCGGCENYRKKSLKLDHSSWTEHSKLNQERFDHSAVTAQTNLFIFGGMKSATTYEYLLKDTTMWLPGKTEIPKGFSKGCAIAVKSEQEIWLIGGYGSPNNLGLPSKENEKRILRFNVNDHTFQLMHSQLNISRSGHRCAFIPNTNKIMITGGAGGHNDWFLNSTEILDTQDGNIIMASPMNFKRREHGMGVVTIDGKERLAVFGGRIGGPNGHDLDTVEIYNTLTEKWEITDIKMEQPKSNFGFLTLNHSHILSIT